MSEPQTAIRCSGLVHIYKTADVEVVALQGLDMTVYTGEIVAIVGASGSGKTTLMNVLSAVERPSAGQVVVEGVDLAELREGQRDRYRQQVVGYVWQQARLNVMADLTVEQNLQMPLVAARRPVGERQRRAAELMSDFGLEQRWEHRPGALSGGEQQLLAVAIALANRPRVLLADEPTAGLDRGSARDVLSRLREVRASEGTTVVMVTHDQAVTPFVDRVLRIRDGRVSTETSAARGERVVLDRAGRLQLPRHLVEEVGLRGLVSVRREGDGILIEPAHDEGADG
jgi:putative ABC transport system ATP-binding protein